MSKKEYSPGTCPECHSKDAYCCAHPSFWICKTVGCVNCNVKPTMKYTPSTDFDLSWSQEELKTSPGRSGYATWTRPSQLPLPLPAPSPIPCAHVVTQYVTHGSVTGYFCDDCGAYLHP